MKKGRKGIAERTLTRIAATSALVSGLGTMYSVDKAMTMDNDLGGLDGKVPAAEIQQIKEDKNDMENGSYVEMVGLGIGAATLGYAFGRRTGKKDSEAGPLR